MRAIPICSDTSADRIDQLRALLNGRIPTAWNIVDYLEATCQWDMRVAYQGRPVTYATYPPMGRRAGDLEREWMASNPRCLIHDALPVGVRQRYDSRLRLHQQVWASRLRTPGLLHTIILDPRGLHAVWQAAS